MIDFKLDDDGDLYFKKFDFSLVSGEDYVVQKLKIKLKFFKGEWYLDSSIGIPYFDDVFKKQFDIEQIENSIKVAILETKEVLEILEFDMNIESRNLFVTFKASLDSGQIIDFEVLI